MISPMVHDLPLDPTELDEARAHLRNCQSKLFFARQQVRHPHGEIVRSRLRVFERDVLAALSWVWDAQGRDPVIKFDALLDWVNFIREKYGLPAIPA